MNPIAIDLTIVAQTISFLLLTALICVVIYFVVSIPKKRQKEKEISEKLERIIDLLENRKKDS